MKLSLVLASVMMLTTATAFAQDPAPTPAPSATPLQTRPSKKLELSSQNEKTPVGYKILAGAVVVAGAVVWAKKKKGGVTKDKKKSAIDLLARHSVGVRSELLVVDVEGTRLLVGMTPGSMSTLAVLQTPEGVVGEESPLMGEEKYMAEDELEPVKVGARASQPELEPVKVGGRASQPELVKVGARASQPELVKVGGRTSQPEVELEPEPQPEEVEELEGRVRSLLEARKKKPVSPTDSRPALRPRATPLATRAVPGQAKGLLLSMQAGEETTLSGSRGSAETGEETMLSGGRRGSAEAGRGITKLGDW